MRYAEGWSDVMLGQERFEVWRCAERSGMLKGADGCKVMRGAEELCNVG